MYSQRALIAAALAGTLALLVGCERSAPTVAHNVSGPISSIDQEKGIVEIITEPATLRLRLAPGSTQGLSTGEIITARLELAQATEPPQRAYDAPESQGDQPARPAGDQAMLERAPHSVTGKVTQIDHSTGVFDVRAGEQTLTLYFPPDTVRDLKDGDEVTVRMKLSAG